MKENGIIFTAVGLVVMLAGIFVTKDYNAVVIGGLFTLAGITCFFTRKK